VHKHRHTAALAHEARAELLEDLGRSTEARASLRRAMTVYEEWGAPVKARALGARLAATRT
jgi:predicted RNA polymerase sigma factor